MARVRKECIGRCLVQMPIVSFSRHLQGVSTTNNRLHSIKLKLDDSYFSSTIAAKDCQTLKMLIQGFGMRLAPGTKSNYRTSLRMYFRYCTQYNINPLRLPYDPYEVGFFLAARVFCGSIHSLRPDRSMVP